LRITIPLPPLDEQRRIVARVEQLAAKIEEVRDLRRQVGVDVSGLLHSAYARVIKGADLCRMRDIAPLLRRPVQVDVSTAYRELGIRSFGNGIFHKPPVQGVALGTKRIYRIEPGDLLFNIVFAWEGAVAVAGSEDRDRVGSHRFLTCVPREGNTTSAFLRFHFLTPAGLDQLGQASPGGAGRNRTLGVEALANITAPVPPIEKQLWFDGLQARADALKRLQADTAAKLDALLPSVLDRAFKGDL
jgi:type I restriction enzyme S subunit